MIFHNSFLDRKITLKTISFHKFHTQLFCGLFQNFMGDSLYKSMNILSEIELIFSYMNDKSSELFLDPYN